MEMEKIFIPSAGINIDICINGCGGIYFDNREFKHFDEVNENIQEIIDATKDKEFIKVDENVVRQCPICGTNMVKNYSSIKKTIKIDECYVCGGKFLDGEELQKIRSEYNTEEERIEDAMAVMDKMFAPYLQKMEDEHNEFLSKRSSLKKFFDQYVIKQN